MDPNTFEEHVQTGNPVAAHVHGEPGPVPGIEVNLSLGDLALKATIEALVAQAVAPLLAKIEQQNKQIEVQNQQIAVQNKKISQLEKTVNELQNSNNLKSADNVFLRDCKQVKDESIARLEREMKEWKTRVGALEERVGQLEVDLDREREE